MSGIFINYNEKIIKKSKLIKTLDFYFSKMESLNLYLGLLKYGNAEKIKGMILNFEKKLI